MRFLFKTSYDQEIVLFKHEGHRLWYGLLIAALIVAPWAIAEYWLAQLSFVLIYSIVGLGLMLLAGFTGQVSIGHAAFLGVGAYTQAYLTNLGVPFPIALVVATLLSAGVGVVVGVPALRVKGIYLGIATLAFGFIVEEVFARWEIVTGGNAGIHALSGIATGADARHGAADGTGRPAAPCGGTDCGWSSVPSAVPDQSANRSARMPSAFFRSAGKMARHA
jgi:branched-chain amino acid transport system permease protein